jgi:signal transduction histidine kinase
MDTPASRPAINGRDGRLLTTLQGLLAIPATDAQRAFNHAAQVVADVLGADKVDIFLYDPAIDTLVAMGTSDTPMGRRQVALGLNRLPLSNGGRAGQVFQTGECYHFGHVEQDPDELRGIKEGLGIRSAMMAPLNVNGTRRGLVQVDSAQPDQFTPEDLEFLDAVAHWVGSVVHRTELVARLAQDAAEEARRRTASELITMLAHDLRVPLAPVRGYLGMIRMQAEREGHHSYLRFVAGAQRGVERLTGMLSDLLDTSRLERGVFDLTPEAVNLGALVRETADTLRTPTAPIEVRVPDDLVVEVDPQRVRQALENLLGNALRHSPDGVPVILELATQRDQQYDVAVITVQDAGPGIPPELLPKLFTRFSAGGKTGGLGLGLYLARGIAEAHGGTLTASSRPGQGATFRLSLPLPKVHG